MTEEQDVIQAETTAEAPSAENETVETTQDAGQEDSETTSKTVPYDRFQEVISSKNELKKEIDALKAQFGEIQAAKTPASPPNPQEEVVKQQLDKYLKDMGYVNKAELEQKEADQQLQNNIKALAEKYNGKDGRPKFDKSKAIEYAQQHLIGDLEIAYKQMHEAELMDYNFKVMLGKTKAVKTETSDGSGSADFGTSSSDLMNAAARGDKDAMAALIKRAI